jgi:putative peptidoglycan lipid II flippase
VSEQLQNQALLLGLLLAIPACLCLMVLSTPVVQLSYQRGAFSAEDVAQTAHLLQLLAALIPVAVVLKILLAWLYARADIQIPMQITLITLAVHTLAAWFATQYWGLSGLAGATVVSLSLCLALLARRLAKQGGFKLTRATQRHLCQIGLASLGTAGYCWLGYTWVLSTLSAQTTWFALGLLGLILSALACYFGLCASFGLKLWILMHGDKRAS